MSQKTQPAAQKNSAMSAKEAELIRLQKEEELARLQAEEDADQEAQADPVQEADFGPVEALGRTARAAISGATLQASERLVNEPAIAAYKLLVDGKIDEAKSLLENYDSYRDREWQRQKKFEQEYPVVSKSAEMIGSIVPGTPTAKLATAGLNASTKFLGRMGQAAVTGGVAAGAHESAEILGEPDRPGLGEAAKRIGTATAVGAVAAPVIGAGVEGVMMGAGKLMTSLPALKMVQVIAGPPVRAQKEYLKAIPEIEALPSEADVVNFMGGVRERVIEFAETNGTARKQAQDNVKELQKAIQEQTKTAKADVKIRLQEAEKELARLHQELTISKIPAAQDQLELAKQVQTGLRKEALKDPSMGPEVANVSDAVSALKTQIIEESQAARALIGDDVFFDKRDVINAYKEAIQGLRVKGTEGAPGRIYRRAIDELSVAAQEIEKTFPERLTGEMLKDTIKQLDNEWQAIALGQWGEPYPNAIKSIRRSLDRKIKSTYPEYEKAMEPIAEKSEFLERLQQELSAGDDAATRVKIQGRLKEGAKNPVVYEMFDRLEKETGIGVTQPIKTLKDLEFQRSLPPAVLPQEAAVKELKLIADMAKSKNFEDQVFASIQDQPLAQAIIDVKRRIDIFRNPEFVEKQIQDAVRQGQMDLATAQQVLAGHEQARQQMAKAIEVIGSKGVAKPEDMLMRILRAPDGKFEQAAATRMVDAITSLPEESFKDLFESLALRTPEEVNKLAKNLRLRESLDRPRTNGSRRAVTIGGFFNGLVNKASAEPVTRLIGSLFSAVGPVAGAYLDEFGGAAAKSYLRAAARMQGIPTGAKYRSFATAPMTARVRNAIAVQIGEMATNVDPEQVYQVAEAGKPAVERDIKQSKMSALDRAKALNELNQLGGVSGKYMRKIMLESTPQASSPMEPEVKADLEADKPDMAQRLSKRAEKSESVNLASYLKRAT